MGKSSSYRGGPGWQGSYLNPTDSTKGYGDKGSSQYSKGGGVKAEGTHMSGDEMKNPRKGAKSAANKSRVSYSSSKVPVPTGYS